MQAAANSRLGVLTVPRESLTSRVANSHVISGKLMLKLTLSRSP